MRYYHENKNYIKRLRGHLNFFEVKKYQLNIQHIKGSLKVLDITSGYLFLEVLSSGLCLRGSRMGTQRRCLGMGIR